MDEFDHSIEPYNSIKFARKQRGLDAAHKTRIATYFKRYV